MKKVVSILLTILCICCLQICHTAYELKMIYNCLKQDIDIFSYPDSYDPFNAPGAETMMISSPSQTIIISVTENVKNKTVTCKDITFGTYADCYSLEAEGFMKASDAITKIIKDSPEWLSFPEYENFYD